MLYTVATPSVARGPKTLASPGTLLVTLGLRSTVSVDFSHMRVLVALSTHGFQLCILEPEL